MIANITGNWYKHWSPKAEAGERIYRAEEFLANNGYTLAENSPICVRTGRVILNHEVLESTEDKPIWEIVEKRIRKTSGPLVSNLHGIVYEMLNISPYETKKASGFDYYEPGEIAVRYNTNKGNFNFVELAVKTPEPFSSMCLGVDTHRNELLFNWGHTNRLVVDLKTADDELGKEILRVARRKK